MAMNFISHILTKLGTTTYSLAKELRANGVEITHQGVDNYNRSRARGLRLDVLAGIRKLSGLSWEEMGAMIDDEYLSAQLKKRSKKG